MEERGASGAGGGPATLRPPSRIHLPLKVVRQPRESQLTAVSPLERLGVGSCQPGSQSTWRIGISASSPDPFAHYLDRELKRSLRPLLRCAVSLPGPRPRRYQRGYATHLQNREAL
jgi:hypothetical protein